MNKESFPSLDTIIKDSKVAKATIIKSISRLEKAGYFKIIKEGGTVNKYIFNDYKKFEIFSFDFLTDEKLTPKEKAYLIITQSLMYKDKELGIGKITLSDFKLSEVINLDLKTMKKYEKSLQEKKYTTISTNN